MLVLKISFVSWYEICSDIPEGNAFCLRSPLCYASSEKHANTPIDSTIDTKETLCYVTIIALALSHLAAITLVVLAVTSIVATALAITSVGVIALFALPASPLFFNTYLVVTALVWRRKYSKKT